MVGSFRSVLFHLEKALAVFDRLAVLHQHLDDGDPLNLGLDLVHDLHGLDNADHRVFDDSWQPTSARRVYFRGRGSDRRYPTMGDWQAVHAPPDLQFEALLLDRELGEFGALHQVYDLFDLFKVQRCPWLIMLEALSVSRDGRSIVQNEGGQ
jgi:hypothetical protein